MARTTIEGSDRSEESAGDHVGGSKTFGDRVLNRGVNRLTIALLRSPVHRLVSGSTLLLHVTGRRSGRALRIPVSYKSDGNGLLITSLRRRRWWRNLRGGAAVRVLLRGEQRTGHAKVLDTFSARKGTVLIHIELDPPGTQFSTAGTVAPRMVRGAVSRMVDASPDLRRSRDA